jgi:hypothetical protein
VYFILCSGTSCSHLNMFVLNNICLYYSIYIYIYIYIIRTCFRLVNPEDEGTSVLRNVGTHPATDASLQIIYSLLAKEFFQLIVFHLPPCCLILALSCLLHSSQCHCVFNIFIFSLMVVVRPDRPDSHRCTCKYWTGEWAGQTAKTYKWILSGQQKRDSRSEETWRKG